MTSFPEWFKKKNWNSKTIIKIIKSFQIMPVTLPQVQMKSGDLGDKGTMVTKMATKESWSKYQVIRLNRLVNAVHFSKCISRGSWRRHKCAQGPVWPVPSFCIPPRLLCVGWLGSALKASRTLISSSWSSLGLWIPSCCVATWRRVLCSVEEEAHCTPLRTRWLPSPLYLYVIYYFYFYMK